jgi:hypothetical protein
MPPLADGYFAFRLPVVFVEMKKSNFCITHINRISTGSLSRKLFIVNMPRKYRYVTSNITLRTLLLGMMLCSKGHNIHSRLILRRGLDGK